MVPAYVIDSSVLISLAKINLLQIIKRLPREVFCPEEVYQEVIETGYYRGYADAFLITREIFLPNPPLVKTISINNYLGTRGISPVDDSVLSMAAQKEAVLLTDDIRLRKKANDIKFKTFTTPELLIYYLDNDEFSAALNGLVKHKRLSVKTAKMYLEVKKKWEKR